MEETHKKSLSGKCISLSGDDDNLYAALMTNELVVLSASDLNQKSIHKLAFDVTCMCFSKATQQVWCGDKKGVVHVLKVEDMSEVYKFDKHQKAVTSIAVSEDGSKVASGDGHRYFHIHDAATHATIGSHGYHKGTIYSLSFSEDASKLCIVSQDLSFSVFDIASGKSKVVKKPHDEK